MSKINKIINNQTKLEVLLLYRNILKLHYHKLNEEMRLFGDYFVKSEFTLNYKQADEEQIKMFIQKWREYYSQLKSMKDIKTEINVNEDLKTKMDLDQKKTFDDIRETIENKNI
jgi:hypothetical protein